jgi:hypothetical protein
MTVRRAEKGKSITVRTAFLIAGDMGVSVTALWPSSTRPAVAA